MRTQEEKEKLYMDISSNKQGYLTPEDLDIAMKGKL